MKKQQPNKNNKNNNNNANNNSNNVNNEDINKKVEEMYLMKEELREDIILDKRKILDLDQRNNLNIEALDNIVNMNTNKSTSNKNGKLWIYTGDIFIQMKESNAKELIIKENDTIESEIESLQKGLVEKQQNLKNLERDYQFERNKLFT